MPRLFTGIEIPLDIAFDLEMMRGGVWGARWVERSSLHLTLRFIGDVSEQQARVVDELLAGVDMPRFSLRLKGIGTFGGARPRAIWVGVDNGETLKRLQATQERICQQSGLKPDGRKFVPHVTIARLKNADLASVERFVAAHNLYESRAFEIDRFVLFSSRPSRGGGPYGIEEVYPLNEFT